VPVDVERGGDVLVPEVALYGDRVGSLGDERGSAEVAEQVRAESVRQSGALAGGVPHVAAEVRLAEHTALRCDEDEIVGLAWRGGHVGGEGVLEERGDANVAALVGLGRASVKDAAHIGDALGDLEP
jgi:hypothetical protein